MKKTITNLSKSIVKADSRFNVREDLNFNDDGNRFKGFDYKGLPITTLRSDGLTYLCIRVDYLSNEFTYEDWSKTEEYRLADEFNGVPEIDFERLVENCERIIAKVDELNRKVASEELDMTAVCDRLKEEKYFLMEAAETAKVSIRWWELDSYRLDRVRDAMKGVEREIQRITKLMKELDKGELATGEKRRYFQRMEQYGYVVSKSDSYWVEVLREEC